MTPTEKKVLKAKAKILKAMAHPTRLWMVEQLANGERCVCEFVNKVEVDFSTISKHLLVLKQAGLVIANKRGKQVFYRLKARCALSFIACIEDIITDQKITKKRRTKDEN